MLKHYVFYFNKHFKYSMLSEFCNKFQAFEESVDKDKMLAVGHFMLGNVSLALNR